MGIHVKLAEIQKQLFVPKGQKNDFGKYNYRSCEDILKTVKPICAEQNCVLYITNDLECIGGRNYVKAIASLTDIESGECITSCAHAREEETKKGMDGSQITGSSSSYARKYALAGLFCIDNEKDSDATNDGTDHDEKIKKAQKMVDATRDEMIKVTEAHYPIGSDSRDMLLKCWGIDKLEDATDEQLRAVFNKYKGK